MLGLGDGVTGSCQCSGKAVVVGGGNGIGGMVVAARTLGCDTEKGLA